jgi:hypothetical protein
MSSQSAPRTAQPRLGMRYGQDVWALKTGSLFLERSGRVVHCTVKNSGLTPAVPSLKAAVEGIHKCYGANLAMGTDPEFFVTRGGQIVPAFDHLPDKHSTSDGLFWDGFQAECTVDVRSCEPVYCTSDCDRHKNKCHAILAQKIGRQLQLLQSRDLGLAPQPIWRIPHQMLQLAGMAQVSLGCDPSRNAYGHNGRCVPEPRLLPWRFAGGHVHFELTPEERSDADHIRYLVKTLDALLGIPSVCLAQNYDHFIRRRYYGLAGEYRLPPHGLEYRTLSNFWLMHPRAFMLVFDLARHVLNIGRARLRNIFVGARQEQAIAQTINYCDVRSAKDFMRLNREFYTAWSRMLYGSEKAFWAAIEGGVDKVIPHWGQNVLRDWVLHENWQKVPAWRDLV